jgi:hypothetical protein
MSEQITQLKETMFRNEDGVISWTKVCVALPLFIIMGYAVRDLVLHVPLTWEHTVLLVILFTGGLFYRIDAKRLGARLTNISLGRDGVNLTVDKDHDLLNHLNKQEGIQSLNNTSVYEDFSVDGSAISSDRTTP